MLRYLKIRIQAFLLRLLARVTWGIPRSHPDQILHLPSRDKNRTIKVHVYRPKLAEIPGPVLVNFHGSGWVLPLHGSDDEFCRRVANEAGLTVLDVRYRLAPEWQFPAANEDAEDVVRWVKAEESFAGMSLSGFSAGGHIATVTCGVTFPKGTFDALVAFYPPTNLSVEPEAKRAPDTTGRPLPYWLSHLFRNSYIPLDADRTDHNLSPLFAPLERFPPKVLIVTAACDTGCLEAEALAGKLTDAGREVVVYRAEKCDHGWDKGPKAMKAGTYQEAEKVKVYSMAVEMLLR